MARPKAKRGRRMSSRSFHLRPIRPAQLDPEALARAFSAAAIAIANQHTADDDTHPTEEESSHEID